MSFVPDFQVFFDTEFSAIRCVNKIMLASHWTIQTQLLLSDETDSAMFEYAIKKISFWVESCLHHSIIFDVKNIWAVDSFLKNYDPDEQNNIVLTPLPPDDAHLSCLILAKFNALVQNLAVFESIKISSNSDTGVSYVYYGTGSETLPNREDWFKGKFAHLKPWWERPDTTTWDAEVGAKISPQTHPLFDEFFKESRPTSPSGATIIKGDFKGKS
jgi:hypothetical protein